MAGKLTDLTLAEQLHLTPLEIRRRLQLYQIDESDGASLAAMKPHIAANIDALVEEFYDNQTSIPEVVRVIGDAESLTRLKNSMKRYILSIFDGQIGRDYVQSRLRIGMVHKRIGVSPKLYIAAVLTLSRLLRQAVISMHGGDCPSCSNLTKSLEKLLLFDLALVLDTYILGLMDEVEQGKEKIMQYANGLEEEVAARTGELRELARKDGLTGLINQRTFYEELRRELSRCQRLGAPLTLVYLDVDKFKQINDVQGHLKGDEILIAAARAMQASARLEDVPARYGGDEFVMILPQAMADEGEIVCRRLIEAVKAEDVLADISLSIGLASTGPEIFIDGDELVKAADQAMYVSKKTEGFAVNKAG